MAIPTATVVGSVGGKQIIESPEAYGGFYVRRHPVGIPPYTVNEKIWQRPDFVDNIKKMFEYLKDPLLYQKNKAQHIKNNDAGFTRLDYAFLDAANTMAEAGGNSYLGCTGFQSWGTLEREDLLNPMPIKTKIPKWNPAEGGFTEQDISVIVKKAAKFLGASLSGITMLDERWFYRRTATNAPKVPEGIDPAEMMAMLDKMIAAGNKPPVPPIPQAVQIFKDAEKPEIREGVRIIPKSMKWVVVMAFEMDHEAMETDHSAINGAATANGYSRMSFTTASLAEFFRGMGYNALPLVNDTALSVPMAIAAGLGELGRNGVVITPKYGPRVRLAKVVTDMPLIPDQPISFGVTEFCEICGKCAEQCPGNAIAKGSRSFDVPETSGGNPGALKWAIHGGKCFGFWNESGVACSNCIRVCPFNKPDGWLHKVTRMLIGGIKSKNLDRLLLKLDDASGYGRPIGEARPTRKFWGIDRYIHIKE